MAHGIVKHYVFEDTRNNNRYLNKNILTTALPSVATNLHMDIDRRIALQDFHRGQGCWRKRLLGAWTLVKAEFERLAPGRYRLLCFKHRRKQRGQPFHKMADINWKFRSPRHPFAGPTPAPVIDPRLEQLRINLRNAHVRDVPLPTAPPAPPFRRPTARPVQMRNIAFTE